MAAKKIEKDEDKFVLAFDPGGTTGMALLRYNKKEVALSLLAQIDDAHMGFYDNLVGTPAGLGTPITLVSEKWVEHGVKGADRSPLVIEGVQYAFWPDQTVYQTPDMKQLISDDVLKEIGVWTPGKRHQMDALIHALIYLRNQGHEPTLKLLGEEGHKMQQDGQPGQGGGQEKSKGGKPDPNGEPDKGGDEAGAGDGGDQPDQGDQGDEQDSGSGGDGDEQDESQVTVPQIETGAGGTLDEEDEQGGGLGDGDSGLRAALATILPGEEVDVDETLALIAETQRIYDRERDLDGAFAGWQADVGAERKTLIDEEF